MYSEHLNISSGKLLTVEFIKLHQRVCLSMQRTTGTSLSSTWKTISRWLWMQRRTWSKARSSDSSVEDGQRGALELCQWKIFDLLSRSESVYSKPIWECLFVRLWYAPLVYTRIWIEAKSNRTFTKVASLSSLAYWRASEASERSEIGLVLPWRETLPVKGEQGDEAVAIYARRPASFRWIASSESVIGRDFSRCEDDWRGEEGSLSRYICCDIQIMMPSSWISRRLKSVGRSCPSLHLNCLMMPCSRGSCDLGIGTNISSVHRSKATRFVGL